MRFWHLTFVDTAQDAMKNVVTAGTAGRANASR
jgi:hypothetical protein